jgi:hypothetical protein
VLELFFGFIFICAGLVFFVVAFQLWMNGAVTTSEIKEVVAEDANAVKRGLARLKDAVKSLISKFRKE